MNIPVVPRAPRSQPLADVITATARALHVGPEFVGSVLAYALEEIVHQMRSGHHVVIPGFGSFGTRWLRAPGSYGHAVPVFCPAAGLRNEIRPAILNADGTTQRRVRTYRKRHACGGCPRKANTMASDVLQRWQLDLKEQAGGSVDFD